MEHQQLIPTDLAPLPWWEHPWYVGLVGVGILGSLFVGYGIYRLLCRRAEACSWHEQMATSLRAIAVRQTISYAEFELLIRAVRDSAVLEGYLPYRPDLADQELLGAVLSSEGSDPDFCTLFKDTVAIAVAVKFAGVPLCQAQVRVLLERMIAHLRAYEQQHSREMR